MTLLAILVGSVIALILATIDVHFVIRKHRHEIEELKDRVEELEDNL